MGKLTTFFFLVVISTCLIQYIAGSSLPLENEEQGNATLVRTQRRTNGASRQSNGIAPKRDGFITRLFKNITYPFRHPIKALRRLMQKFLNLIFPNRANDASDSQKLDELEQKIDDLSNKIFPNNEISNGEPTSELKEKIKQILDELVDDEQHSDNPNQDRINDLRDEIEHLLDDIPEENTEHQQQSNNKPAQNTKQSGGSQNGQNSQNSDANCSGQQCQPIVIVLQQPGAHGSQQQVVAGNQQQQQQQAAPRKQQQQQQAAPCNQQQQQAAPAQTVQIIRPIPPPLANQQNPPC